MRGRKPTPSTLKLLRGNPGHRPINPDEPHPDALDLECPPELTDDGARREWERAIVPAIRIGQITASDRTLSIAHCALWSTWQSQLTEANKHPHVIAVGQFRYPRPNPLHLLALKTLALLAQVDEKLGFSPCSRGKVQTQRPAPRASVLDKRRAKFFALTRG